MNRLLSVLFVALAACSVASGQSFNFCTYCPESTCNSPLGAPICVNYLFNQCTLVTDPCSNQPVAYMFFTNLNNGSYSFGGYSTSDCGGSPAFAYTVDCGSCLNGYEGYAACPAGTSPSPSRTPTPSPSPAAVSASSTPVTASVSPSSSPDSGLDSSSSNQVGVPLFLMTSLMMSLL